MISFSRDRDLECGDNRNSRHYAPSQVGRRVFPTQGKRKHATNDLPTTRRGFRAPEGGRLAARRGCKW
ncbi:MAG: hypothetical protein N2C14_01055 [Planctomycetales bacterium]